MKNLARLGVVAGMAILASASHAKVTHEVFKHGRAWFHVIKADLREASITARTLHSPKLQSFADLVSGDQPQAAITGTFFDTRSGYPVGDVLEEGKLVAQGARGSVLAIDWLGRPSVFDSGWQERIDWSQYRSALRGTVRVVNAGKVAPNPKAQKFKDRRVWGMARRSGAGVTEDGQLVLVATTKNIYLSELGKAMASRGVVDGVNLDGGSSTALMFGGKMLIKPARKLSNLLAIYETQKKPGTPGYIQVSSWMRSR